MSATHNDYTEALDFPNEAAKELADVAEIGLLLQATAHPLGQVAGLREIFDLRQYTLYDSGFEPSSSVDAGWALGFAAGVAFANGVTPQDAEELNVEDVHAELDRLGIKVEFFKETR